MRLLADGAVGHGAGGKALHDGFDRFDLLDRYRLAHGLQIEQTAQRRQMLGLVVDGTRVFLEKTIRTGTRGVLQHRHRFGIEQMVFAVTPPLVFTAPIEFGMNHRALGVSAVMPQRHFAGDHVDADTTDARSGPGKILVDKFLRQADGLENLGATIRLNRRDAHLREHLEHAFVQRLDVILDRLLMVRAAQEPLTDHVIQRLEGQVRVDRAGAVPQQQRQVMNFTRLAGFDYQAGFHA